MVEPYLTRNPNPNANPKERKRRAVNTWAYTAEIYLTLNTETSQIINTSTGLGGGRAEEGFVDLGLLIANILDFKPQPYPAPDRLGVFSQRTCIELYVRVWTII